MKKIQCWAIKSKRGTFVQHDAVAHFEAFRNVTFRTRRDAAQWLSNDPFWKNKAYVVRATVTIKETGE